MIPAEVVYIGYSTKEFTNGKMYEAFFVEYWQGERRSLHVRNNFGEITDFNPFEDFEIVSDIDNLLNFHEAIVKCINDSDFSDIEYGKTYKAIGRDKNGMYLVMDESYDCYFYHSDCFEVIEDKFEILKKQSVYYSFCD
ncbi:hypothetical protein [uncultured Parvimonas sp.]|uniref:hypothetical protein n=1 Tax=uncultured Parvimonas sp. TaxID=747372 RepID=UPI002592B577|nr:hypothetical protein [uncultured Parvimonas sp.]